MLSPLAAFSEQSAGVHDLLIRGGTVYDGSGSAPYTGMVAIDGDRITYAGTTRPMRGRTEVDATGLAVAPGFINLLSHAEETLLADGRGLSDLAQGVTLEVMGESSMGPLNRRMRDSLLRHQGDIHYPVTWSTLEQFFVGLEQHGISPNVAAFVGHSTIRNFVLGEADVQPTPADLGKMVALVHQSMEGGALGITTALIYAPATYAKTPELVALARESARCGGLYSAHIRSEGDSIGTAIQETIDIARASGGAAHVYHLKLAGRDNWSKRSEVVSQINEARRSGLDVTADMYTYAVAATGLDATMPPWVQSGGLDAWISRMKDPSIRTAVVAEMRSPKTSGWENYLIQAGGASGVRLLSFNSEALKPLSGKTLAEVASMREKGAEETAMDLVIEDGSRVGAAYTLMSEDNVRAQLREPWVAIDSDEGAPAPQGVFTMSLPHPRAYGSFARFFAKYVREQSVMPLAEAVRRVTSLPADVLSLPDRGRLQAGVFADVVVFDPATIQDHATFEQPHRLATGVSQVIINGRFAIHNGQPSGEATGRFIRGRGWRGAPGGGCRQSAQAWKQRS